MVVMMVGSDRDNDDDDGWKVWQKWGAQPGEQRLWLVLVKTVDQGTHGEVSEKQYNGFAPKILWECRETENCIVFKGEVNPF